ncbi:zf-RING-2 multi-domain protein [Pyrenophora tritici-repentis]|nr:zf-RING-2 multi-domain protein [Pyrenophora tritici-repentis]
MSSSYSTAPSSPAIGTLEDFRTTKIVPLPTACPGEICCICQETYDKSHQAVTVLVNNCYHRFGQECLERYLNSGSRQNNTCPQCKRAWYTRVTASTNTSSTANLPPVQAQPEPRPTTHETRSTVWQEEDLYHRMANGHLAQALEHLDMVEDIISNRRTTTRDILPVLKIVERRAKEIHDELQHGDDVSRHVARLHNDRAIRASMDIGASLNGAFMSR